MVLSELAERLGPDLAYWLDQPAAFALWNCRTLQERDRVDAWVRRMERIQLAELVGMAVNDPVALDRERTRAIADAGPPDDRVLTNAHRMITALQSGRVMEDGPELVS